MTDEQLFNEVFDRLNKSCRNHLSMKGTMVCWDGDVEFNTDGYTIGWNLYNLTKLVKDHGYFN